MDAEQLIKKFNLNFDAASSELNNDKRYTWEPASARCYGDVMGVGVKDWEPIVFAQDIYFEKEDVYYPARILCFGWEQVEPAHYERKLKELRKKYNKAVKEFKEHAVLTRIKQLNQDF